MYYLLLALTIPYHLLLSLPISSYLLFLTITYYHFLIERAHLDIEHTISDCQLLSVTIERAHLDIEHTISDCQLLSVTIERAHLDIELRAPTIRGTAPPHLHVLGTRRRFLYLLLCGRRFFRIQEKIILSQAKILYQSRIPHELTCAAASSARSIV
jgi:hypothetical protein